MNSYKRVFSSPEGKIVLTDLMSVCGVNRPMVTIGDKKPIDPVDLAVREGMRMTVIHIMNLIKFDEKRLLKAIEDREGEEHYGY